MSRGEADLAGYLEVEGFFGPLDAEFYDHQVSRAGAQGTFVEIGSWKGRSSYCMAEATRALRRVASWRIRRVTRPHLFRAPLS